MILAARAAQEIDASMLYFMNKTLRQASKPVFVTGDAKDARAIKEAGGEAVALGDRACIGHFTAELEKQRPAQPLVIALFDRGDITYWQNAAKQLTNGLEKLGISYWSVPHLGQRDSGGEWLAAWVERAEAAARRFVELYESASEAAHMQACGAEGLPGFMHGIDASVDTPSIPTGFKELDRALDDGLREGLYIIGAISTLGKTTLVLQIADQVAAAKAEKNAALAAAAEMGDAAAAKAATKEAGKMPEGADVLIFSLEMARTELMARSISRQTRIISANEGRAAKDGAKYAKTARGITTGKRYNGYSKEEHEIIAHAIAAYAKYAGNLYYFEGVGDMGAAQIRAIVERHIRYTGDRPVVVVDYLQIIAPHSERATDKQNTDKAVLELKRMSRDHKIPVIAISSFNRANYKTAVSMEAFKESGAVEYSSDVLIGLQLKGAGDSENGPGWAMEKLAESPRKIELVILKNRNGKVGGKILYEYYPMYNYFDEDIWRPAAGRTKVI